MTTSDAVIAKERERPSAVPLSSAIPEVYSDDYQELAAWYSGFAFCEHYRKVVQAQCREAIRVTMGMASEKLTESRLDDLSRLHPSYLDYLAKHLRGRIKYEREFLARGGMA